MKFKPFIFILLCSFILLFKSSWGVDRDGDNTQLSSGDAAAEIVTENLPAAAADESQISFREIWGYLMQGEEKLFIKDAPITDVFYFSATVNAKGRVNTSVVPPLTPAFAGGKQRVHIVISDLTHSSRMHLCLTKKYGVRPYLVKDLVELTSKFDGIQIDFEAVRKKDGGSFVGFLRDLKRALPAGKILSVAVPAKRGYVDDAYDYKAISHVADRVLVMAYDQHWSKSKPGPVASLKWSRAVAEYASKNIPNEKLIMGLPLYGREWRDQGYSRAIRWYNVTKLMERDDAVIEYSLDEGFKVMYDENMKSTFYFDDIKATRQKLTMYSDYTDGVGFWRLGMENVDLWNIIRISRENERFASNP
jgi:spore germination protein YaaH